MINDSSITHIIESLKASNDQKLEHDQHTMKKRILTEFKKLSKEGLLLQTVIDVYCIKFFDKKFKVLESKLPLEITSDQVSNILDDLLQFVNIITSLACCFDGELKKNAIFGKVNMGLPSASRIVYLFTIIINNDGKSDEDQLKLVDNWKSYFIWLSTDANSRENFIAICRTGGDNHASGRKFDRIQAAVSNFALNSMDSDE
jgi:hypothetical protein